MVNPGASATKSHQFGNHTFQEFHAHTHRLWVAKISINDFSHPVNPAMLPIVLFWLGTGFCVRLCVFCMMELTVVRFVTTVVVVAVGPGKPGREPAVEPSMFLFRTTETGRPRPQFGFEWQNVSSGGTSESLACLDVFVSQRDNGVVKCNVPDWRLPSPFKRDGKSRGLLLESSLFPHGGIVKTRRFYCLEQILKKHNFIMFPTTRK